MFLSGCATQDARVIEETDIIEEETIKESEKMVIYFTVNDYVLTVELEDNSSAIALYDLLKEGSIDVDMRDYANMEKVGPLPESLPRNDKSIVADYGDVILYQGNALVIYYDQNSWSFTKLGSIQNITQEELKDILGTGNVVVTISID
jgi:hypothetical protein